MPLRGSQTHGRKHLSRDLGIRRHANASNRDRDPKPAIDVRERFRPRQYIHAGGNANQVDARTGGVDAKAFIHHLDRMPVILDDPRYRQQAKMRGHPRLQRGVHRTARSQRLDQSYAHFPVHDAMRPHNVAVDRGVRAEVRPPRPRRSECAPATTINDCMQNFTSRLLSFPQTRH